MILWDQHYPDTKVKDTTRKAKYRPIFMMSIRAKKINRILANQNSIADSKDYTPWLRRIYPVFSIHKKINVIYHIKRIRKNKKKYDLTK
jgi:hypothetical protein